VNDFNISPTPNFAAVFSLTKRTVLSWTQSEVLCCWNC
jgi:hypothetical protein